ncbi:MAG: aquaporin [Mycobacteriales bacterium]
MSVGPRRLVAEAVGTAFLVFVAVGVATLSFGFGATGSSISAGVVATALAFGLVLLVLAYGLGPISGCHVNPAVTMGFLVARRMTLAEALGYWGAQVLGGIVGALGLYGLVHSTDAYRSSMGLGADGIGKKSMTGINSWGALLVETLLTFLFVLTVLSVTRKAASPLNAGIAIGFALTAVHLIGIPFTGTSVNPARSIGPALFVGGLALSQLWIFILAPMVGGAIAALAHEYMYPASEDLPPDQTIVMPDVAQSREAAHRTPLQAQEG